MWVHDCRSSGVQWPFCHRIYCGASGRLCLFFLNISNKIIKVITTEECENKILIHGAMSTLKVCEYLADCPKLYSNNICIVPLVWFNRKPYIEFGICFYSFIPCCYYWLCLLLHLLLFQNCFELYLFLTSRVGVIMINLKIISKNCVKF